MSSLVLFADPRGLVAVAADWSRPCSLLPDEAVELARGIVAALEAAEHWQSRKVDKRAAWTRPQNVETPGSLSWRLTAIADPRPCALVELPGFGVEVGQLDGRELAAGLVRRAQLARRESSNRFIRTAGRA